MPFKKQSPGCRCCSATVVVHHALSTTYPILGAIGGPASASVNVSTAVGYTVDIIGVDLERKYVLYRRVSNDEVWLFDPVTQSAVSKLWNACDASLDPTGDLIYKMIWYVHSWGVAYGVKRNFSSLGILSRYAFSLDSSGNYLNGPYAQNPTDNDWCLENLTITDNGDLYLRPDNFIYSPGGVSYFYIYKNSEIDHPRPMPPALVCPDPFSSPGQTHFTPLWIFSDGTELYIQISIEGRSHPSLARGIYSIDLSSGALSFVYDDTEMMPDAAYWLRGLVYNPTQGRFEGSVDTRVPLSLVRLGIWTDFADDRYLTFPVVNTDTSGGELSKAAHIPLTPPNIEEYWDAL